MKLELNISWSPFFILSSAAVIYNKIDKCVFFVWICFAFTIELK